MAAADTDNLVEQLLAARRYRNEVFGSGLFSDPAWDIVLTLFLAQLRREALSLSRLAEAISETPAATSRWLDALADRDLVREWSDPPSSNERMVQLSAKGSSAVRRSLSQWLNWPDGSGPGTRVTGLLDQMLRDEPEGR